MIRPFARGVSRVGRVNDMRKKAFQISTTCHPNAEHGQAYEVQRWLTAILSQIARDNPGYEGSGPTVTIVVEVLDE